MKNIIFLTAFILIVASNVLYGHTCSKMEVECPIDGTTVEFCVTMSMTTHGNYFDFQQQGAIGIHYEELINRCPKCNYSGNLQDFDTTFTKEEKNKLKQFLSKYDTLIIDDALECKLAGDIKEFLGMANDEISNCFLIGSYLLRKDSERIDFRKELQSMTKDFLIKALQNDEYKDSSIIASINYLIAEMYRRIGNFEQSIIYYDKALTDPNKQDWVQEVALKQKEMAIKKDDDNDI
ncbi:MAG: DUF2225 domain-containing protein [Candidatus Kapabacteria bacterium]|nr:DUF2225 domain-containing protein [Candidatus Kapabacteria bacterium]